MGTRILIVEDEEKIARFVELELLHEGYCVDKAVSGRQGLEMAENGSYDLMLLDVMLPELNGLEVLRRLRRASNLPVIMLTARDAVMDKVAGLDSGADDYITKPFAIEELLARIRLTLKKSKMIADSQSSGAGAIQGVSAPENRQNNMNNNGEHEAPAGAGNPVSINIGADNFKQNKDILSCREVIMNKASHRVTVKGQEVELTNREFIMLQVLLENINIVLSRDTLLEKVCGYDYLGETNVIDVYIRYLRCKIDDAFDIKLINTVRGVGYMIKSID